MSSTISTYFHEDGSPGTGGNYGPASYGAGYKLTRVEVRGAVIFTPGTVTTSPSEQSPVVWGIQQIPFGGTPASIATLASWDGGEWLKAEAHVPDEIAFSWAPSTDSAGAIAAGPIRLTWVGQLYAAGPTSVYFSVGQPYTSGDEWEIYGSLRAWIS